MTELAFKINEYQTKLAKTRERMSEQNINVLVVSDPANMYYLTGYDAWSFYVHQVVVLEHEGDPYWIGRESDASGAVLGK